MQKTDNSSSVYQPLCTHLTMTRLYSSEASCDTCRRPASCGWLYCCTQDHEPVLMHSLHNKLDQQMAHLDSMAETPCKVDEEGSNDALRRNSLLKDLSPGTSIDSYTPEQVAILLQQRDHVRNVIRNQVGSSKPWLMANHQMCRFQTCSACRWGCAERSFLSLAGIANGDIPSTAATGYGFHQQGCRPVSDVNVVRNIGLNLPKKPAMPRHRQWRTPGCAAGTFAYDPRGTGSASSTDESASVSSDETSDDGLGMQDCSTHATPRPLPIPPTKKEVISVDEEEGLDQDGQASFHSLSDRKRPPSLTSDLDIRRSAVMSALGHHRLRSGDAQTIPPMILLSTEEGASVVYDPDKNDDLDAKQLRFGN